MKVREAVLYEAGQELRIESLEVAQINEAYANMPSGEVARGVIVWE